MLHIQRFLSNVSSLSPLDTKATALLIGLHNVYHPVEGTRWSGYELVWVRVGLGTSWSGYEMVWVRVGLGMSWFGYELVWVRVGLGTSWFGYELVWVRVDPNLTIQ